MLFFLPPFILGILTASLYIINVALWFFVLLFFGTLRFIPIKPWQHLCTVIMNQLPIHWSSCNRAIQWLTIKTKFDIQGLDNLNQNEWYLIICNHQTWADIIILQSVLNRKIPSPKFFIKKELLWTLPFAGLAAWFLNFPFMSRHSKEFLAKHPEQKYKDIEATKKSCEKFKNIPTTVINFIEGTRFTAEKHEKQQSPYQYLLRPRAGGIGFALTVMGEYFHQILNVTIVYPRETATMWDYIRGKIKKITIRVETIPITKDLLGDYENDRQYRVKFQNWINQLWQDKDELIKKILANQ